MCYNCAKGGETMKRNTTLKWLYGRAKGQLHIVAILVVLRCASAVLGIAFAFLSKNVIDAATSKNMDLLLRQSVITACVILCQIGLSYLAGSIRARSTARLDKQMKRQLFNSITKKDYAKISSYHSGDLLTRISSDIGLVSDNILTLLPNLCNVFVTLILAMIGLMKLDLTFSLVFICGAAVFLVAVRLFGKYLKSLHKRVQSAVSKGNSFFQESISNLLMIKVFGIEPKVTEMSDSLQDNVLNEKIHRSNVYLFSSMGAGTLFSLGGLYALLWSAYQLAQGRITFGTLTAIIQLVNRFQDPVADLSSMVPGIFTVFASAERIMEIENLPDEADDREKINPKDYYDKFREIKFNNVSFAYDKLPVITNASFSVPKGSFVVISGHSGIGKSTLMKLLLGVYQPDGGSITLSVGDEEYSAGKPMRPLFAYVPQGNMVLSGSIREALTMVCPEADDEELWRAAEISCAKEFLEQLPKGLDTEIGENGLGLSEGQVQRLAITRAVLSGAGILLLDEATSALDAQTEAQVLQNLRNLKDKTCVIISHKPSAFKYCDMSLSMVEGEVKLHRIKSPK